MYAILLALALATHIFSYLTLSPSAPTLNQVECDKKKLSSMFSVNVLIY